MSAMICRLCCWKIARESPTCGRQIYGGLLLVFGRFVEQKNGDGQPGRGLIGKADLQRRQQTTCSSFAVDVTKVKLK